MRFLRGKKFRPQDLPLKIKLLAITFLVVLLISLVAFLGFRLVVSRTNEMVYTQTASSLGVLSDKIAGEIDGIIDVSLYLAVNKDFQANLRLVNREMQTTLEKQARENIFTHLYRSMQSAVISCTVFPENGSPILWGSDSSLESSALMKKVVALASEAQGRVVWLPSGREDGSLICAREIRHVALPFLERLGYIVLRVDIDRIIREAAEGLLSMPDYGLSLSQGEELLYSIPGMQQLPVLWEGENAPYAIQSAEGSVQFLTRSFVQADRVQWELVLSIPYDEVFDSLIAANTSFLISLLLAGIAAVLLSRRLFAGVNRHLLLLKTKMDRVRAGDLEPFSTEERLGEDELGALNRDFDRMTADFKKVIEDNYVKELLLTQTQLKALEQQINPHFLYNSLESIHWFSRRGDGEAVTGIVQSLGRLLRSTLSENEDKITLERELFILDNYLNIQRLRFPDTLCVRIEADEQAKAILVPKMSIQPLVENAIVHSLEENIGVCHIDVRVRLTGDRIRVEVQNDGSEIEEDILERLRSRQVKTKGNGIGLMNIDSRIKLLFGPEYGLQAKGGTDRTAVSFEIPAETCPAGEEGA
ncbi:MAG: sensor histidine kinase [Provencibacterium sp.]|jgi:two-component system sensor histidine kinase YesM|nr:sensor histidine kinase [Provencibacterium sp.]